MCHGLMDVKVTPKARRPIDEDDDDESLAAGRRAPKKLEPKGRKYKWEEDEDDLEDEDEEMDAGASAGAIARADSSTAFPPMSNIRPSRAKAAEFGITVEKDGNEGVPTLEQLRESGGPVERVEGSRSAPTGNNRVTTAAELVQEMLKGRQGGVGGQS